jgi:hypothetical protein
MSNYPNQPGTPPPAGQPNPLNYMYPGDQLKGFNWPDFLSFKYMITMPVIQVLFYIFAGLTVLGGLFMMLMGLLNITSGGAVGILIGLLTIVIGPVVVRLYAEFVMVIFRINATLNDIRTELQSRR